MTTAFHLSKAEASETGPAAVARSLALAAWARTEITRQRGPRPAIVTMHNLRPATPEQQARQIDEFTREMKSRDAAAAWDRAVMDLIRRVEAGRAAA